MAAIFMITNPMRVEIRQKKVATFITRKKGLIIIWTFCFSLESVCSEMEDKSPELASLVAGHTLKAWRDVKKKKKPSNELFGFSKIDGVRRKEFKIFGGTSFKCIQFKYT